MQKLSGARKRLAVMLLVALTLLAAGNMILVAQNLGAAPQVNVAVQGTNRSAAGGRVSQPG
ncbi:MAG: hypothetical protein IPJ98_00600 [Bryobacterales bacterium]|nr:hypothetical protein [Bryobacterales bacterium]